MTKGGILTITKKKMTITTEEKSIMTKDLLIIIDNSVLWCDLFLAPSGAQEIIIIIIMEVFNVSVIQIYKQNANVCSFIWH